MGLVSIITPCSRPDNLDKLYASMNWDLITKWYIVYDTSKDRSYIHKYTDNDKIAELDNE